MLLPLALIGIGLFALTRMGGKGAAAAPPAFKPVEVTKELEGKISQAGQSQDWEFVLNVFDEVRNHPKVDEPQMAFARDFLLNRIADARPTQDVVAGQSGRSYKMQLAKLFSDGVRMYDLFTPSGAKILRFRQNGSDLTTRKFIDSPPGTDPSIMAKAKQDFHVNQ